MILSDLNLNLDDHIDNALSAKVLYQEKDQGKAWDHLQKNITIARISLAYWIHQYIEIRSDYLSVQF